MNKTKLASFKNVIDIKKYFDLSETYDKFENKYSLSSKIFKWGWGKTEICFIKETVNTASKYFFHLKYHSDSGIPNIYEVKILLNDAVLSFKPVELSYHNDGQTYWRLVSGELSLEQISQIIGSTLCEIRVDEKFGNKDYANDVAKEFREKLKDFFEVTTYIAGFPESKEGLLLEIAAEKETEAVTKLQADEERKLKAQESKLKAQEEKKARGTGAKIFSLVKWILLIVFVLSIINTFFGEKTTSKTVTPAPKVSEQAIAPNQQEINKDQGQSINKDSVPQSDNK